MSIARKDDRHNENLVGEISDSFNRAIAKKKSEEEGDATPAPRFIVTGDSRAAPKPRRRDR